MPSSPSEDVAVRLRLVLAAARGNWITLAEDATAFRFPERICSLIEARYGAWLIKHRRGLSRREIEDALVDLTGNEQQPLLSRSTVSQLTDTLWEEYEAFAERDLSGLEPGGCVFVHRQHVRIAAAASWPQRRTAGHVGILAVGQRVLIHVNVGNQESTDAWVKHFRDLVRRGVSVPATVTTDGAPGLIKAVKAIWPEAERIRCWVHKMRVVLDKPAPCRTLCRSLLTWE